MPLSNSVCPYTYTQVDVVRCLMDLDGDGQVSFAELVQAIKEAYGARKCVVFGLLFHLFFAAVSTSALRQSLDSHAHMTVKC